MSRFFFAPMTLLLIAFALLILFSRALSPAQAANPILEGFRLDCEGVPQPCWYGLQPGVTTLGQSYEIVRRLRPVIGQIDVFDHDQEIMFLNTSGACSVQVLGTGLLIDVVSIANCPSIRLGDLMVRLGQPEHVRPYHLTFLHDTISARAWQDMAGQTCLDIDPQGVVQGIRLHTTQRRDYPQTANWRGFLPDSWYARDGALSCL